MVKTNVLSDCLKTINNAEHLGKRHVLIRPVSRVTIKFLRLMQKHGFIGDFEYIDDHRAGKIGVNLIGRLNKCGCISPRYNVQVSKMESWIGRLLPARSVWGCFINNVSRNHGYQ